MAKPVFKTSPLMLAIRARNLAAVRQALDEGADVNETDIHGHPGLPLRTACFEGDAAIVSELVNHGADINAPGCDGKGMPLRLAVRARNRSIVDLLLASGATIEAGIVIDFDTPENPPVISEQADSTAPVFESLDIPLLDVDDIPPAPRKPSSPLIEEVKLESAYGVDTNVLNQDMMRLVDEPPGATSRRNRADP